MRRDHYRHTHGKMLLLIIIVIALFALIFIISLKPWQRPIYSEQFFSCDPGVFKRHESKGHTVESVKSEIMEQRQSDAVELCKGGTATYELYR